MASSSSRLALRGSIHGRFQPFHKEHLEYALEAKRHCRTLVVGLTDCEVSPEVSDPGEPHRWNKASNPFTYFERYEMVLASLSAEGIPEKEIVISPFPIDAPTKIPIFIPLDTVCFLTHSGIWSEEKVRRLTFVGYRTSTLYTRTPSIRGSTIRNLISKHDESWTRMVPPVVRQLIRRSAFYTTRELSR